MNHKHLSIYLNDHLAGAVGACELLERMISNNSDGAFGAFLPRLLGDVEEDKAKLEQLMSEVGVKKNLLKDAAAWLVEKVGRLKLNGQLTGYSDLSRLIELDTIKLGVEGKLALWRSLETIYAGRSDSPPVLNNLDELIKRAESQLNEIEHFRQEAARIALG